MPAKITQFAKKTKQKSPESPGQFVRCCLDGRRIDQDLSHQVGDTITITPTGTYQ